MSPDEKELCWQSDRFPRVPYTQQNKPAWCKDLSVGAARGSQTEAHVCDCNLREPSSIERGFVVTDGKGKPGWHLGT